MATLNPPGFPIERGKIHEFANSLECDEPLFHDEDAAKAAGLSSVVMPITYSSVESFFPQDGATNMIEELGLDLRFVLHGGQEWTVERPITAGETLTSEKGEFNSFEKEGKRGGTMKFFEMTTDYKDAAGDVVMRSKSTIIQTGGVVEG